MAQSRSFSTGFLMASRVNIWIAIAIVGSCQLLRADDWMTWPSTYTHDSLGNRVDQHTLPVEPMGPNRSDLVRSGYRHLRSTIQAGTSADNYHVTERWGGPITPYEQWRFPYRPYGVPYDAWGPQMPQTVIQGGWGGFGVPYFGAPQRPNGPCRNCGGPGSAGNMWHGNNFGNGWGNGFGHGMGGGYGQFPIPLQPQYRNQPWFDGMHPEAPPLGR